MGTWVRLAGRVLVIEWRYTYRSARRDGWSRRYAARLFVTELAKGWADLPAYVAEVRR